ncbi:MAG: PhzF family phenazine biosynthesis protein [Peptostreptococcus sp.]|uniref:PhzF family phenazine biosynthesis protein n=1 Tax=Peptostreptococcus sp. TaxID=1262 RepID=UPI002FC66819
MKQYVVDAFTDKPFAGNPAAVCVLDKWPSEDYMMKVAIENNLSETAFIVKEGDLLHLRWFTPGGEVDLCGHATLASAYVYFNFYEKDLKEIIFKTLSGNLTVVRKDDMYEMDFPAYDLKEVEVTDEMEDAIGARPLAAFMGRDLVCVLENESLVREKTPDLEKVKKLDGLLLHTTAAGTDVDCVSRSFPPKLNISEDPVCGSGHCHIVPYWVKQLGKNDIVAYQASKRGGTLYCRQEGNRMKLAGKAALFSIDEIFALEEV